MRTSALDAWFLAFRALLEGALSCFIQHPENTCSLEPGLKSCLQFMTNKRVVLLLFNLHENIEYWSDIYIYTFFSEQIFKHKK